MPNILRVWQKRGDSSSTSRPRPNRIARIASKEKLKSNPKTAASSSTSTPTGNNGTAARIPRLNIPSHSPPVDPDRKRISQTILTPVAAELALDDYDIPLAISLYLSIPETPQTKFNIAQLHLLIVDRVTARKYLEEAVAMDNWFAVGWFQLGYVEFVEARYEQAIKAYTASLRCMRNGRSIRYQQVGLAYTITFTAVLWGRAAAQRAVHDRVYKAGERPQSVPVGAIFRVHGRLTRATNTESGENTNWKFLGPGGVRAISDSVYERV